MTRPKFKDYTTYFCDYFDYLDSIEDQVPKEIRSFFCNEDRYKLNNNITLHDAWIEHILIRNQYEDNGKKSISKSYI